MDLRFAATLALAAGLAGCAAPHSSSLGARVLWTGTYTSERDVKIPAPATVMGTLNRSIGMKLKDQTENIPGVIGTKFGVTYVFEGGRPGEAVLYRSIWWFPSRMTNPVLPRSATFQEGSGSCRVGSECLSGWTFAEPWEILQGTWTLELWHDNERLLQQRFQVSVPQK